MPQVMDNRSSLVSTRPNWCLPDFFQYALYHLGKDGTGIVTLHYAQQPSPAGWHLILEDKSSTFFHETAWKEQDSPSKVEIQWQHGPPPSGFWISWAGTQEYAWWPVNIVSTHSLPPPEDLRVLPLEVLINILTSARPLHKVFKEYIARKESDSESNGDAYIKIDPQLVLGHKKK